MSEGKESASTQTVAEPELVEQETVEKEAAGEVTYHFRYTNSSDTPAPSSTPVPEAKPYRFSDNIHKDRHIFLKGASLGIGCGNCDTGSENGAYFDWNSLTAVGDGRFRTEDGYLVDEYGNVFYQSQCVQVGPCMALSKNEHMPALHRVELSISSADRSKRGQHEHYPHVHQQHQPTPRRRPFNEQLNTYVDTQKRIRSVQCLEDLYRASPPPGLPFLITPRHRTAMPKAKPTTVPFPSRLGGPREATSLNLSKTPSSVSRLPSVPLLGSASDGPPSTSRKSKRGARTDHSAGSKPDEAERELASARVALKPPVPSIQVSKSYATYASQDYLSSLSKDGRQGTFGRLFESYPKRVLVHPGRLLLRQRTELPTRTRPQLW